MRRRPAALAPLLPLLPLLVLSLSVGCGDRDPARPVPARGEVGAASILRTWDVRRAHAWAAGSVRDLRALYAPGSRTAAADVRMLRQWRARGLRVRDLTTQLLAVHVLASRPGRLRLRVTDRVVRAEAVPATDPATDPATGPAVGSALPRGGPSTYVISLGRYDGQWLVRETTGV